MLNQRTRELEISNPQTSLANVQLKEHDKVQRDFINIASHETQDSHTTSTFNFTELKDLMPNQETVLIVFTNAKKLQDLANAILGNFTRIESNTIQILQRKR